MSLNCCKTFIILHHTILQQISQDNQELQRIVQEQQEEICCLRTQLEQALAAVERKHEVVGRDKLMSKY